MAVINSDILGIHYLVCGGVLEHAVLVYARGVGESVPPDYRLVGLHGHVHKAGDHPADGKDAGGVDACLERNVGMAAQYHSYLLEGRIAGPFSYPVYRHFALAGARKQAGDRVGRGHTEVVMAVCGDDGLLYAVHMLDKIAYLGGILRRQAVPCSVRYVDDRRPGLNHGLHHAREVFVVGTAGVLGIELHILYIFLRIADSPHGTLEYLLAGRLELMAYMLVRSADTGMYPLVPRVPERFGRDVDILLHGPREGAYYRPCDGLGHLHDGIEVPRTRDGKARLDDVDAELLEGLRELYFLGRAELAPGNLLPVPQGGVENVNPAIRHKSDFQPTS